jgi:hypothetical protein
MKGTILAETTANGPFLLNMSRMVAKEIAHQNSGLSRMTNN